MKTKIVYIVAGLMLVFSLAVVIILANPVVAQNTYHVSTTGSNEHDVNIGESMTIQGAGVGSTIVDAQYSGRVFSIGGCDVDLSGMTIRNGKTSGNGGGIYNEDGTLTMTDCTVSGNKAGTSGGGIYNGIGGTLTMTGCTVSGNMAGYDGGGINNNGGTVTMTNCTVSGNKAKVEYRSADGSSTRPVADSDGGGIYTIGGADTLRLNYCTITDNTAEGSGGGIYNSDDTVVLTCTIVYGNTFDDNIYGAYSTDLYSIVGGTDDPLLGPLQDNGGPTETRALLDGSPAIDACIDCTVDSNDRTNGLHLETDQRGLPRPIDGDNDGVAYCDVGAYEKQLAVGGIVEPVDKINVLAPWLGLAAFIVMAMAVLVIVTRRREA